MSASSVNNKTVVPGAPADTMAALDAVLVDPELCVLPRALILLRVCGLASVLRPELLAKYWPQLKRASGALGGAELEEFQRLRASLGSRHEPRLGRLAREILEAVDAAVPSAGSSQGQADSAFGELARRLQKSWLSPGRGPAWTVLVRAWARVNRLRALSYLRCVPNGARANLVREWNEQQALTSEEWSIASQRGQKALQLAPAVEEILDGEEPALHLPESLVREAAKHLRREVNVWDSQNPESRKHEERRSRALRRYLQLFALAALDTPAAAESIMEALFTATQVTARFGDEWPTQWASLAGLIRRWAEVPALREKALKFLADRTPPHLRDFAISSWFAAVAESPKEAQESWDKLRGMCTDVANSRIWFLIALVRQGRPGLAMDLARASESRSDLVPRVRRVWLCERSADARSVIAAADVEGDVIGEFLLAPSTEDRVKLLRRLTDNGKKSLPPEMWATPDIVHVARALIESTKPLPAAEQRQARLKVYRIKEEVAKRFASYVCMHGYESYGYEDIDPCLLETLVAWDDAHPHEVGHLLSRLWSVVQPALGSSSSSVLHIDIVRNAIFGRCRTVFAARPDSFEGLFVKWVKQNLVDKQMTTTVGMTTYTLSLKPVVPFLFCLLSAETVGPVSAARCDSIVARAMQNYEGEPDLVTAAAQIYASDKGLAALKPPVTLHDLSRRAQWQAGVVRAATRQILRAVLGDQPAG